MVHEGRYTELQIGPARTQMHTFPLPPAPRPEAFQESLAPQANLAVPLTYAHVRAMKRYIAQYNMT